MSDLQNKDETILEIYQFIVENFGQNIFTLPNFWDGDNCAIGLLRDCRLIYISTWDFRNEKNSNMRYYTEFEIVDAVTFETIRAYGIFENITRDDLIAKIKAFLEL